MALDISASRRKASAKEPAEPVARLAGAPAFWRRKQVGSRDMIYFTSQLSLMLEVGTSLTDSIKAIQLQTQNPVLRSVLGDLERDMEDGMSFSAAMSRHPTVFDGVLVSMVHAGELGGYLRNTLDRIVEMREKREALVSQVRTALTYPAILAVAATVVVVFILTGVLPKFMPIFAGKEHILPGTTRFLLAASHSVTAHWWIWLVTLAGLTAGMTAFFRSEPGQWVKDRLAISLPVIGPLTNKILTGQMLRTLGHLLESRVVLLDALRVTRMTLRNRFYQRFVDQVLDTVQGGGRLSLAFQGMRFIPPTVRQMITTGEEAGNLYPVMLRLAQHYDVEIEQALKKLAAWIEPAALIVLGGIVGFIVSSVILPLFRMAHAIT